MNTNRQAQNLALAKIKVTSPYKTLSNFTFIDHAIQNAHVTKEENKLKYENIRI